MTPVDIDLVQSKMAIMIENLNALEPIQRLSIEDYSSDIYKRKATERMLQEIVEAAIDINYHIIVESNKQPPDNYYQSFIDLSAVGAITFQLANDLAPSAGLRNRIVHEYDFLDNKTIIKSVRNALRLYPKYIDAINEYLKTA